MKKLLFLLAFALAFCIPKADAQARLTVTDSTVLTNQVTRAVNLLTLPQGLASAWDYSVHVRADSLTGSNAGTINLQATDNGTLWYNVGSTITVDGPAASYDELTYTGTLYARRLRVYCVMPAGTRTTLVRVNATLRRK